jgi:hypothetical protein
MFDLLDEVFTKTYADITRPKPQNGDGSKGFKSNMQDFGQGSSGGRFEMPGGSGSRSRDLMIF